MRPFVVNGQTWRVIRVPAGDPRLVDRTGTERLAVTDPTGSAVYVNGSVSPPLLDRVLLHEVAHAITVSWGLLGAARTATLRGDTIGVEEWAARLVEGHAIEAIRATSEALGRAVCIDGECSDGR